MVLSFNEKSSALETVSVALESRCYDILIGADLLATAGQRIKDRFKNCRVAIITDKNVAHYHLKTLQKSLDQVEIDNVAIIVEPGEKSKSFATLQEVCDAVLDAKLERGDVIIAFGGGVVGDLAGFTASIIRRGMYFIQIPTSLLAQVDSSVGGKTGINTKQGKNLIGAFYQPQLVLADSTVLNTLEKRQFAAGYAELAKYGLINQPNFFAWLEINWQEIFKGGAARIEAIAQSCQAKAEVVARDERENGERALLNLGHTFGHALETATNYDATRLVHGEAVAIGMVLAHQFSNYLNLCSMDVATRVEKHLKNVGLPTCLHDIAGSLPDAENLMAIIAQDKKIERGNLTFILTRGLGQAFIAKNINAESVLHFLQQKMV